jgi:hypothetical protein
MGLSWHSTGITRHYKQDGGTRYEQNHVKWKHYYTRTKIFI